MNRKVLRVPLLFQFSSVELQGIVYVLNTPSMTERLGNESKEETQRRRDRAKTAIELRRLVKTWQESGPNLRKMFEEDRKLAERCIHGRTLLHPAKSGGAELTWSPLRIGRRGLSAKEFAIPLFISLIVSPDWEMLAGPCERCEKFYLKTRTNQKKYCSSSCGKARTSLQSKRKRREGEYTERLTKAEVARDVWTQRKRVGWKEWVAAEAKLSVHWITRAVNQGRLQPPPVQLD